MANTIIGKVLSISQAVNVSRKDTPYYKRELVLDASRYDSITGEKRENFPCITFAQKHCELLDTVCLGDLVEVSFVLQGRSYTNRDGQTRYFTDIIGYRCELHTAQRAEPTAETAAPQAPQAPAPLPEQHAGGLPF